jgi:hypothetical protein
MTQRVVISTLGAALKRKGIGVSELQRRLASRDVHVSRGALDRLVSDRPLRSISFDLLLPVLDELGVQLGEPFVAMPGDEVLERDMARTLAREATRGLANGKPTEVESVLIDEADGVDKESIARLDDLIRREHPEAFDKRGRLRKRALAGALARRFGGRRLSSEQVDDVIAAGRAAAARRRASE